MEKLLNIRLAKWVAAPLILLAVIVGAMSVFLIVMNSDLYGRLIETKIARGVGSISSDTRYPLIVRLTLHKIAADENAIEASLTLLIDGGELVQNISDGSTKVTAILRDGYTDQPFGITHEITLESSTAKRRPGVGPIAVQSERFLLPVMTSIAVFPFDEVRLRPMVDVTINDHYTTQFRLEVQKTLLGRLLEVSGDNIAIVRLSRSTTEKALIIISSVIFLLLSAMLAYSVLITSRGLTTLEEFIAVGGYLIAAVGFRDLLGLSRAAGTSALEIVVIGIPLLLLTIGVVVSFVRGRLYARQESKKGPDSTLPGNN